MNFINHYDGIIIATDGLIWATNTKYRELAGIDPDLPVRRGEYYPMPDTKIGLIPPLRELLWVNTKVYIGITTEDDLYSFKTGEELTFDTVISAAYVLRDILTIVILLEDGRLRLVHVNWITDQMDIVGSDRIDDSIRDNIVFLTPLYHQLMGHSFRVLEPRASSEHQFLAITDTNRYLIISYVEDGSGNPYQGSLEIIYEMDNPRDIDFEDIVTVREGSIVLRNGRIFSVIYTPRETSPSRELPVDVYRLEMYHGTKSKTLDYITDIQPLIHQEMSFITEKNELYTVNSRRRTKVIDPGKNNIYPLRFLTHYDQPGKITTSTYFLTDDGKIYTKSDARWRLADRNIPPELLTTLPQ